jgi:hypothetical protein
MLEEKVILCSQPFTCLVNATYRTSTIPHVRMREVGIPAFFVEPLGARDCGLLLLVIAATLAYRGQHVVLGGDGAVVGLTVLVEECVVLGTRIGTYV